MAKTAVSGQLLAEPLAALLHDIGKVVVPAEILSKPARLTEVERQLVRAHPRAGAEAIGDIDFAGEVAAIVAQHHERLDGSGCPDALTGEAILPEVRVLAMADVVEAMISHRPHRPALPLEAAMSELEAGMGTLYDAEASEAAIRLFRERGFKLAE